VVLQSRKILHSQTRFSLSKFRSKKTTSDSNESIAGNFTFSELIDPNLQEFPCQPAKYLISRHKILSTRFEMYEVKSTYRSGIISSCFDLWPLISTDTVGSCGSHARATASAESPILTHSHKANKRSLKETEARPHWPA
jgi:hypothetical protein